MADSAVVDAGKLNPVPSTPSLIEFHQAFIMYQPKSIHSLLAHKLTTRFFG
jgi:hypothetical protein